MFSNVEIVHNSSVMSTKLAHEVSKIFDTSCVIKKIDNYIYNNIEIKFLIFPICGDNRIPEGIEKWIEDNVIENFKYIVIILCDLDDSLISQKDICKEIISLIKNKSGVCPLDPLLFDTHLGYKDIFFKKDWLDAVKIFLKTGFFYPSIFSKKIKFKKVFEKKVIKKETSVLEYIEEILDNGHIKLSFVNKKYGYKRSTLNNLKPENINLLKGLLISYDKLQHLSIPNAGLNLWPDLPDNVYKQIEVLDIRGNNFIDYSFLAKFKNLKKLNLAFNNLKFLPNVIFNLKKLKILMCHKNFILNIDKDIKKLKNLERLTLYRNNINNIPIEISQCSNLISINLGANNFESVPNSIFFIESLKELSLRNCNLKLLDKKIYKFKNLLFLDVSKNNKLQLII